MWQLILSSAQKVRIKLLDLIVSSIQHFELLFFFCELAANCS